MNRLENPNKMTSFLLALIAVSCALGTVYSLVYSSNSPGPLFFLWPTATIVAMIAAFLVERGLPRYRPSEVDKEIERIRCLTYGSTPFRERFTACAIYTNLFIFSFGFVVITAALIGYQVISHIGLLIALFIAFSPINSMFFGFGRYVIFMALFGLNMLAFISLDNSLPIFYEGRAGLISVFVFIGAITLLSYLCSRAAALKTGIRPGLIP